MAIYHLRAKVISRAKGKSATASAAYQSAEKIKDERTGLTFDYTRKQGVNATEIIAPNQAPDWVNNRAELWNNAELFETRKNSRTAREIELALPIELNQESNQELVRGFVKDELISKGLVVDLAFHNMESHNPHAHIMFTTRVVEEKGFGIKDRSLDKKEFLIKIRENWETHVNQALEQAGVRERIDHRSLEDQGINRIPQIHLGANVAAMMKKGIATERGEIYLGIIAANQEIEALELDFKVNEKLIEYEHRKNTQNQPPQNSTSEKAEISVTNNQLISLEEEEVEKDRQENSSSTVKFPNLGSQTTENEGDNHKSDAQLITLEKQWSYWEKENQVQTYFKKEQKEKISRQIQQLELDQTQLTKALAAQKRQLAQFKPRSLFNPFGDSPEVIKKSQKKLTQTQSQLNNVQKKLRQAHFQLLQWEKDYQTWFNNPHNQNMRKYSELRATPEISARRETLLERYSIHKAAEYILDLKGSSFNNIRSVEGNNYRISQLGKTITITNKPSGELLYRGTDEREKGGIIEVKEFKLSEEDKKAMFEAAQHLIKEEQKLNSRGIER